MRQQGREGVQVGQPPAAARLAPPQVAANPPHAQSDAGLRAGRLVLRDVAVVCRARGRRAGGSEVGGTAGRATEGGACSGGRRCARCVAAAPPPCSPIVGLPAPPMLQYSCVWSLPKLCLGWGGRRGAGSVRRRGQGEGRARLAGPGRTWPAALSGQCLLLLNPEPRLALRPPQKCLLPHPISWSTQTGSQVTPPGRTACAAPRRGQGGEGGHAQRRQRISCAGAGPCWATQQGAPCRRARSCRIARACSRGCAGPRWRRARLVAAPAELPGQRPAVACAPAGQGGPLCGRGHGAHPPQRAGTQRACGALRHARHDQGSMHGTTRARTAQHSTAHRMRSRRTAPGGCTGWPCRPLPPAPHIAGHGRGSGQAGKRAGGRGRTQQAAGDARSPRGAAGAGRGGPGGGGAAAGLAAAGVFYF